MTTPIDPGSGLDSPANGEQPFGLNSAQVQIFLDELAALDLDRAVEVWDRFGVALRRGHAAALDSAARIAAKRRPDEWARARDAATAIVQERLGESPVAGEVVPVLADVAGSIVVRDLLPRHDFRLLQLPWTWRVDRGAPVASVGLGEDAATVAPVELAEEPAAVAEEAAPEQEPLAEAEPAPAVEPQAETESQPEAQAAVEPEPETAAEPEPEAEAEPEAVADDPAVADPLAWALPPLVLARPPEAELPVEPAAVEPAVAKPAVAQPVPLEPAAAVGSEWADGPAWSNESAWADDPDWSRQPTWSTVPDRSSSLDAHDAPADWTRYAEAAPFAAVAAPAAAGTAEGTHGSSAVGELTENLATSRAVRTGLRVATVMATVLILASLTRLAPGAGLFGPASTNVPGTDGGAIGEPSPSSSTGVAPTSTGPAQSAGARASSAPGQTHQPTSTVAPTHAPAKTPAPTSPPAPTPTPAPTPSPTPTAAPSPTAAPGQCTVANLVGVKTSQAQLKWNNAGFTGKVFFSPQPPPTYKIGWQSLTPGSTTSCSHDINVRQNAP